MPLFKKSSDASSIFDVHQKALHHCRVMFLKDLDLQHVLEYMSLDDNFLQDCHDFGGNTREEQIAHFLNCLGGRSEKSFGKFMDYLKEHQRHLYSLMEENIHSFGNTGSRKGRREDEVMTGDTLRRLLRKKTKDATHQTQTDQPGNSMDAGNTVTECVEQYIDCYSILNRGRQQKEKWIKHISGQKPPGKDDETLTMSVMKSDSLFRRVNLSEWKIPDWVRIPPKRCEVYVYDNRQDKVTEKKAENVSPSPGKKTNGAVVVNGTFDLGSEKRRMVSRARDQLPPPVPPKPNHLPLLGLSRGGVPLVRTDSGEGIKPFRSLMVKPSVLKNTASGSFLENLSKPAKGGVTVRENEASTASSLQNDAKRKLEDDFVEKRREETERREAREENDDNLLDCNVSMCSSSELAFEGKQLLMEEGQRQDLKLSSTYEPAAAPGDKEALPMYSTVDLEKKNNRTKGESPKLRRRVEVSVDQVENSGCRKEDEVAKLPEKSPVDSLSDEASPVSEEKGDPASQSSGTDFVPQNSLDATDPPLPTKQFSAQALPDDDDDTSSSNSYYEDIETLHSSIAAFEKGNQNNEVYLDPEVKVRAFGQRKPLLQLEDLNSPKVKFLPKDYFLIVESAGTCQPHSDFHSSETILHSVSRSVESSSQITNSNVHSAAVLAHSVVSTIQPSFRSGLPTELTAVNTDSTSLKLTTCVPQSKPTSDETHKFNQDILGYFHDTKLAYDKDGHAFYVPCHLLKKYGEPDDEPWFYPFSITSRETSLFLMAERLEGCFVVYRSLVQLPGVIYNLSVSLECGDVVHYHLIENVHGDVMVEGHDHSFMTVADLVEYFSKNKSTLATRLRRPLRYARLPITPGFHYDIIYELERRELSLTGNIIGQGNFGVVCAGVYHNHPVAVKVLQQTDGLLSDEDDFLEEAKSLMGLRHEHVVRLVGVSCLSHPFFIVTEFASRGSVKECLRNGRMPSDSVEVLFDICIQMVSAMSYLEGLHFMLHRDLASRNFLMADDFCVKLADFGRARLVVDDCYQAPRKECVCIKWASPEVLIDSRYSTKSDIWAMGVVFWEVFSRGERPYASLPGEQTAVYVVEGGRLEKPHACPPDLYQMMRSCWKEDPLERPTFSHLYEKLRSKSSLYNLNPSDSQNRKQSTVPDINVVVTPVSSKPTTPSSTKSRLTYPAAKKLDRFTSRGQKEVAEERRNSLEQRLSAYKNHAGTSSSETSLASGNGFLDAERGEEDLTRSDRIRKSLRKLMKMKTSAKAKSGSKLDTIGMKEAKTPPGGIHIFAMT